MGLYFSPSTTTVAAALAAFAPPQPSCFRGGARVQSPGSEHAGWTSLTTFFGMETPISWSPLTQVSPFSGVTPFSLAMKEGSSFWSKNSVFSFTSSLQPGISSQALPQKRKDDDDKVVRIGIVGGGIAGVSVAHSLARRLKQQQQQQQLTTPKWQIIIFEAYPQALEKDSNDERLPPQWQAATARNANSMVPAAAMHVFSRKSVLAQVMSDSVREFALECRAKWLAHSTFWREKVVSFMQDTHETKPPFPSQSSRHDISALPLPLDASLFDEPPPYFAVHLLRCVGPSASNTERMSFVRFVRHFLYYTLWKGDVEADSRGHVLVQLAQANRAMYLDHQKHAHSRKSKFTSMGHSQGFFSIHRTLEKAQAAVQEAHEHGEEAHLVPWEEAVTTEPHLNNIPVQPLYVVKRPNDYTANCQQFVRQMIDELQHEHGVEYKDGDKIVGIVDQSKDTNPCFAIRTQSSNGSEGMYCTQTRVDHLVLAAGTETPLLAAELGLGHACPTYPLRGYSLTLFATPTVPKGVDNNFLRQPFSFDSMYCSSVSSSMARFAGFGEFVGYRNKAKNTPSVAPSIMEKYIKTVFPDASLTPASVCFRPISPDDLPLVGETPDKKGVYLHTGHGTLGWTMGLATGDCLAQVIQENLQGKAAEKEFVLANGSRLPRSILSPNRFVRRKQSKEYTIKA